MSNVTVTKQGAESMKDNAAPGARQSYVDRSAEYRPTPPAPPDFRVVAVRFAGASLLVLVMGIFYFAWRVPTCWGVDYGLCGRVKAVEPVVFLLAFLSPFVGAIVWGALWVSHKRAAVAVTRAEANRTALTLDRWGNPVAAEMFTQLDIEQQAKLYWQMLVLASETKKATAPYETLPQGLNTYSPNNSSTVNPAALLEAGEPGPSLVPDSDWLRWINRAPHLLIAGRTEAGKTTMATALLAERILAGDQVLVLDPHYQPGKWFGIEAVSGIPAILETLPSLVGELDARYEEFKRGRLTEDFERLTVLIDEVPAIVDRCIEFTGSGRPKVVDHRWARFARRLGSEARKVRISVVLLSQSTLVQDLMINVQMRENFIRIGLGDQARPLLAEEDDSKRKHALMELLRGQEHPAAMEYKGDFYLLDTGGVREMSQRNVDAFIREWDVSQAAKPDTDGILEEMLAQPLRYATTNGNGHQAVATAPARSVAERSAGDGREAMIKQMRRQRGVNGKPVMSQDAIRAALAAMGIEIAQDLLVRWCQEVDEE